MIRVIIEGPDGSGKSTLCKELSEKTGWKIYHSRLPKDFEDIKQIDLEVLSLLQDSDNWIVDRVTSISDPVYREAFSLNARIPGDYLMETLKRYKNIPIVFCEQPENYQAKEKSYKDDGYHKNVKENAQRLRTGYKACSEIMSDLGFRVIGFNYLKTTSDKILEIIE